MKKASILVIISLVSQMVVVDCSKVSDSIVPNQNDSTSVAHSLIARTLSQDNVQLAIDSCVTGDTVIIPSGTVTWTSRSGADSARACVHISHKNITLRGNGTSLTTIVTHLTESGNYDSHAIWVNATTAAVRVSGIHFIDTATTHEGIIYFEKRINLTTPATGARVDHCRFDCYDASVPGGISTQAIVIYGLVYGVSDYDTMITHNNASAGFVHGYYLQDETGYIPDYFGRKYWDMPSPIGSGKCWYVENGYFDCTTAGYEGDIIDGDDAFAYVLRYSTLKSTVNGNHTACTSGGRGCRTWEIYKNFYSGTAGPVIGMRASTGVIFNNQFADTIWHPILFDNSRTDSARSTLSQCGNGLNACCNGLSSLDGNDSLGGYPCLDQIGLDSGDIGHQRHAPAYVWGNTGSSGDSVFLNTGYNLYLQGIHIKNGRDYYLHIAKPGFTAYTYPHPLTGSPASMKVSSLTPMVDSVGKQDSINGSGFHANQGNGYVAYCNTGIANATIAKIKSWSNTKIVDTIPRLNTGTYTVYVINNDFQVDSSKTFILTNVVLANNGVGRSPSYSENGHRLGACKQSWKALNNKSPQVHTLRLVSRTRSSQFRFFKKDTDIFGYIAKN